ncbi:MAG: hypothetical protein ACK4P4_09140 [Allorhizobium sp.]
MTTKTKKKKDGSAQVVWGKVILREKPSRKRAGRQDWKFSLETMRLREIEDIIRNRHVRGIPDPTGTDDFESCIAYVIAVAATPRVQDVVSWCKTWAPWVSAEDLLGIIDGVGRRKYMLRADHVAKMLGVTLKERTALGLKTIGACDITEEQRKQLAKETKRARDRNRQEQKRRDLGMADRKSQQAPSISELKPWVAAGVSRATWYRRRETDLSRVDITINGDTLVSSSQSQKPKADITRIRVADLSEGLGDHPPAGFQGAAPHGNDEPLSRRVA